MLITLKLSFLLLFSAILPTKGSEAGHALQITLHITKHHGSTIRKHTFSDDHRRAIFDCVLKSTGTLNEGNRTYTVHFYIDKNDKTIRTVTLLPESTVRIPRTFKLHKEDKEIVCDAFPDRKHVGYNNITTKVPIEYITPNFTAPNDNKHPTSTSTTAEPLWTPTVTPNVFQDAGNSSALFTCSARGKSLALLSWHQMKGDDRVLLKTIVPGLTNSLRVTLNKSLAETDRNTEVFCVVRYFLDGRHLSDEVESERVGLSFNRTTETVSWYSRNNELGIAVWLGIIGAILAVATIVIVALLVAMLRYRRTVKQFERDEDMKNRPPLTLPCDEKLFEGDRYVMHNLPPLTVPPENVYEQVYGHGAGLKRPKVRPTEKRL